MTKGLVTVFGGSGFVGKHVVRALVRDGWRVRVAIRRPHQVPELRVIGSVGQVQLVQANVRYRASVARAVEGADAVINLVGILYEQGRQDFHGVHVMGAAAVAEAVREAGITNFVHMSVLGADKDAESDYSRSRAEAEAIVREIVPTVDITRPSVIFGPEDDFFNRFAGMASLAPALPLIGGGETKFQPVYVGDVAEAIAKRVGAGTSGETYELGGPQVYSFKELMEFVLETTDRKRFLVPLPFFAAKIVGFMGEMIGWLPFTKPFLTRDQVKSLKVDNVVSDTAKTFADLGIETETIGAVVPPYLEPFKKYGQFHESRA